MPLAFVGVRRHGPDATLAWPEPGAGAKNDPERLRPVARPGQPEC